MTHKEERLESLNESISNYLRQLKDKVDYGHISANKIGRALYLITKLSDIIMQFVNDSYDESSMDEYFVRVQLEVNNLLNECE